MACFKRQAYRPLMNILGFNLTDLALDLLFKLLLPLVFCLIKNQNNKFENLN